MSDAAVASRALDALLAAAPAALEGDDARATSAAVALFAAVSVQETPRNVDVFGL